MRHGGARVGEGELPNSFIGPVAKSLAVWLKYDIKMSDRDLQRLFEQMFHLKIDPSSVPGFRNQLARHTEDVYDKLKQEMRNSKQVSVEAVGARRVGAQTRLGQQNYFSRSIRATSS